MRDESLKFLEKLLNTPSPSGHEARGQRVWLDYAKKYADDTWSDSYGNCVAALNKGGSPRIMLAGHADEIGMTVNFINKEGFVYVRKLGGVESTSSTSSGPSSGSGEGPAGALPCLPPAFLRSFRRSNSASNSSITLSSETHFGIRLGLGFFFIVWLSFYAQQEIGVIFDVI